MTGKGGEKEGGIGEREGKRKGEREGERERGRGEERREEGDDTRWRGIGRRMHKEEMEN